MCLRKVRIVMITVEIRAHWRMLLGRIEVLIYSLCITELQAWLL